MSRKLPLLLVIAAVIAAVSAAALSVGQQDAVSLEETLIRARAVAAFPEFARHLRQEPAEVHAVLLDYSDDPVLLLKAQAALLARPDLTRRILPLYGTDPGFTKVLRTYGEPVLLPIAYFLDHPIQTLTLREKISDGVSGAKSAAAATVDWARGKASSAEQSPSREKAPAGNTGELTPEQRGAYAIDFIRQEGHDFLGQFTVDAQGRPDWIQSDRALKALNAFFADGVRNLERRFRSGQDVEMGDAAWAAVDILVVTGAVGLLRLGKAGAAAARTGRAPSASARASSLSARLTRAGKLGPKASRSSRWPGLGAIALTIRSPGLLPVAVAGVAQILGVALFALWMMILVPLLWLGIFLGWLGRRLLVAVLRRLVSRRRPFRQGLAAPA